MTNKIIYSNLGANSGSKMMYIRSTDIEQKNWKRLLWSFPDEALYFMSKGKKIIIIDKCCKKIGKVERIFCPVMTDFFRILRKLSPIRKDLKFHLEKIFEELSKDNLLYRKYIFFKYKLNQHHIIGRTIFCKKEPSVW